MIQPINNKKPLLRGYIHQEAFFVALGGCAVMISKSSSMVMFAASLTYSLGLLLMFGISAIYHRPHWEPESRKFLKRLDHSAIFVLIAGTATPICLLALPEKEGFQLLIVNWLVAFAGVLQSVFWVKAPKFLTAIFYVIMGWLTVPYLSDLKVSLGLTKVALILVGGIVYTLGAVFYATKKPKLVPHIFGYHEFFHAFTVVAALLHFIVIYQLIN
jgi:hemolysin III